jgi:putative ABC transport system permease protein
MAARAYRCLLVLLPGWFREEFAGEMTAVFLDTAADARRSGPAAVIALWLRTASDVARLALRLHADAARQDFTYAVRTLSRTPASTLAIIATLALGLGPAVVVANFLQQVVLSPLPFPEADRLVRVWNVRPERAQSQIPLSLPDYLDYRARQSSFSAVAAHTGTSVAMVIGGVPRQVPGVLTSPELHQVLGVHPVIGRGLTEADSAPGAPRVMLLGAALWRAEFGGRRDVIGEVVRVDGEPTTIVGVLGDTFAYPANTANAWFPLTLDRANASRGSHYLAATGRLEPDVSIAQAQDALNSIAQALGSEYPDTNGGQLTELFGLKEQLNGDAPRLLTVLSGAIAAVLLIACLNVASLLTVRTTVRTSELAVRTALGATARRLRRQLMAEHLTLTAAGGAVAAVIGVVLHRALISRRVLALPASASSLGWETFGLLAALVIVIGAAFAWLTARRSSGRAVSGRLLGSVRQTSSERVLRARQALVVGEVAAALVLVVVGGLMMRSAARLAAVDPGFRTQGVLTFGVVLPMQDYPQPADRARFTTRVVDALRVLPDVRMAAAGAYAPMGDMRGTRRFAPDDRPAPAPGNEPVALDLPVGPGYFEVMGIQLVDGRLFTDRDGPDTPPLMIVGESLARAIFPRQRAVGQRLRFFSSRPGGTPPPTREIVGVVRDVRQDGVAQSPIMQMYAPYAQNPWGFVSFFVLSEGDPARHAASVQRIVNSIDPMRPVRDVLTIDAIVSGSTARHRGMTWMLIALAGTALLLATVGLYGVSATAAAARSRELAIRAALGAQPSALLGLMLRQGVVMGATGVALGAAIGLAATRGLGALLYETPPRDPVTFAGTAALLLAVAALATYLPARRAIATNPARTLRAD